MYICGVVRIAHNRQHDLKCNLQSPPRKYCWTIPRHGIGFLLCVCVFIEEKKNGGVKGILLDIRKEMY